MPTSAPRSRRMHCPPPQGLWTRSGGLEWGEYPRLAWSYRSAVGEEGKGMAATTGPEERTGEAFEFGEQLTVVGRQLRPGEAAPPFTLDAFDPADGMVKPVALADSAGTVRLLNVVNSL